MCYTLPISNLKFFSHSSHPRMPETKAKKSAAKRAPRAKAPVAAAANTPPPCGRCGSVDCDGNCSTPISVRYCGATSHVSHHHARVAAEGQKHVWAAAVIAGLAVVVTVSVAYSAAQASSEARSSMRNTVDQVQLLNQIGQIRAQIVTLEEKVDTLSGTPTEVSKIAPEAEQILQNAP
jgi:hypothetical protein